MQHFRIHICYTTFGDRNQKERLSHFNRVLIICLKNEPGIILFTAKFSQVQRRRNLLKEIYQIEISDRSIQWEAITTQHQVQSAMQYVALSHRNKSSQDVAKWFQNLRWKEQKCANIISGFNIGVGIIVPFYPRHLTAKGHKKSQLITKHLRGRSSFGRIIFAC